MATRIKKQFKKEYTEFQKEFAMSSKQKDYSEIDRNLFDTIINEMKGKFKRGRKS